MIQNIAPSLAFALGVLVASTIVLAIGWGFGFGLFTWVLRHASGFNDFSAKRQDGKVLLGADIDDRARPAKRARASRKAAPTTAQRMTGSGREKLS